MDGDVAAVARVREYALLLLRARSWMVRMRRTCRCSSAFPLATAEPAFGFDLSMVLIVCLHTNYALDGLVKQS
jgi:hypothetical protein